MACINFDLLHHFVNISFCGALLLENRSNYFDDDLFVLSLAIVSLLATCTCLPVI